MADNNKILVLKGDLFDIMKVVNTLQTTNTYTVVTGDPVVKDDTTVTSGTVITRTVAGKFDLQFFKHSYDSIRPDSFVVINFEGDFA